MADYTNKAQQRVIRLVEVLAGHVREGMELSEIAGTLKTSVPTALRDLKNLEAVGWARHRDDGRWTMDSNSTRPLAIIRRDLEIAMKEINQINKDYLGGN